MTDLVRLERDGAVGIIRLDRPPVNAFNSVIHRELLEVAQEVAGNPEIRAVVVYGGERAFAAGADIKEMLDGTPADLATLGRALNDAVTAVARLTQPVTAAITGYALGADFRIVAENAALGLPEITLGVIPGAGGTQRLPRLVGPNKAKELIFTGRPVDGAEAVRIGLANRAVTSDQVFAE